MKKWAFLVAMLLLTGSLSIPLSVSATDVHVDTEVATTLTEIQETTETTTSPTITEPIETPSTTEVVASDFFVEPSECNLTVGESCNLNVKFDKEEYDAKRISGSDGQRNQEFYSIPHGEKSVIVNLTYPLEGAEGVAERMQHMLTTLEIDE